MKDTKKFWDKQAAKFSSSGNKESKELIDKSMEYLNKDKRVLDFACGTGQSTKLLSKYTKEVIGLDYSEEMIRFAKEDSRENTTFLVGTLNHNTLEKSSFDVITAFNVLHLLEDIDDQVKLIYDLLKPGGVFISYTACIGEKRTMMARFIKFLSKLGIFPEVNALSVTNLDEIAMRCGFEKVRSETTGDMINNYYLVLRRGE